MSNIILPQFCIDFFTVVTPFSCMKLVCWYSHSSPRELCFLSSLFGHHSQILILLNIQDGLWVWELVKRIGIMIFLSSPLQFSSQM